MNKEQLLDIATLSDLRKYEQSKEYKDLLSACKNKAETIEAEILSIYENGVTEEDKDTIYDFHDRGWEMKKFYEGMLEKVKGKTKGAEALRIEITEEIEKLRKGISSNAMDSYLNVYSSIRLNRIDILRSVKSFNENFDTILNGLINLLEREPAKQEEVY